ncbi:MAG TPA: DNA primase [Longimicrobiaceae bacterium]|nr:DNA primase [Longimicrobiaceae bacterium]
MIPEELVERIRLQADIVEIVGEHTRLKRSGRTFRGPCPLHGGEGPNFSVDPAKGFYKCFVCGEGGTVYSFLMKHLGMTYPDAIRTVAERVGIEIPDPRERHPEDDPNRAFYDVNSFAADWFRKRLWEGDDGREAREYLTRRGISKEAAERFGLGWAPVAWTAFGDAARKHGIPDGVLLELGLVKDPKSGSTPYDAFRGRIIFPIEDLGGRVVAFGGRILGAAEEHTPKYLNSPETPIYHKGRMLYGLGWSRGAIRKAEAALVVEGYMDYVSLASHGVDNAVAPLGTAMTEEQAELLGKYAPRVILLYDSDKAGLKATFRSGDELLRAGVEVLVATLPQGEDPDSLVRAQGADALRRYLDDAVDVLERKVQILERKGFFASIKGIRQALDALLPTVRATSDELIRGVYVNRISEKTGVSRETLEREVADAPPRESARAPAARPHAGRPDGRPDARGDGRRREELRPQEHIQARYAPPSRRIGPERNLILVLLLDERRVERAAAELDEHDFIDDDYRTIFHVLKEIEVEGGRDPDGAWLLRFPPDVLPLVEELRGMPTEEYTSAPEEFFESGLRRMRARGLEQKILDKEREIDRALPDQQPALVLEYQRLLTMVREQGLKVKSRVLFLTSEQRRAGPQHPR